MSTRSEDIEEMTQQIAINHGCYADHAGIQRTCVRMNVYGKLPEVYVETFRLGGHETATTAFAWKFPSVQRERNNPCEIITRLKTKEIDSPEAAVGDWAAIKFP